MKHYYFTFILIIFLSLNHPLKAQVLPPQFTDQLVSTGWDFVEGYTEDSTGQKYVWEKAGLVWVVDTNGVKIPQPLIDISEEVGNWRDHGMNGFAIDPNFRTNGYFYLYYVVDRHYLLHYGTGSYSPTTNEYDAATICRITRYTANSATNFTTTVPGSRLILLGETKKTGIPVLYDTHSAGTLLFATDGTLIVSAGDGASPATADSGQVASILSYWAQALADSIITPQQNVGAYRAQLIQSLNGKILRLDPATGDGIPSNPFYDSTDARSPQSRVWALGLRNPFRISLKPGTGESDPTAGNPGTFYVGDVGWQFWEDINICNSPGMNFGWPVYQGYDLDPNYFAAKQFNFFAPNPLYGSGGCTQPYFTFHELVKNPTANGIVSFDNSCNPGQPIPATVHTFIHARPVIDYYHGNRSRTGIFTGNNASTIDIDDPLSPVDGVRFGGFASVAGPLYQGTKFPLDLQGSYFHADYGGEWIKQFKFNANDTATYVRDFASNMGPVVFLTENKKDGCLNYVKYPDQIRKICYVGNVNNIPIAVALSDTTYGASPLVVQFNGSQSHDPENDSLSFFWSFGDGFTSTLISPQHTYNSPGGVIQSYWAVLTVTDTAGNSAKDSVFISINNTPPVVNITSFNDGDLYSMLQISTLPLQATVTDAEHVPGQLHYKWNVYFHHNQHEHPEPTDTNKITSATILPAGCDGEIYYYRIRLTVTDDGGLSGYSEKSVYPNCTTDCNGVFNGTAFIDSCNTCVGGNTGLQPCTQDCHGDWGGTAFIDSCSTCVGGNTGLQPCIQDCHGDWGGTAFIDSCSTCVGGNTGLQPCTQDCHGDWGGTAFLDSCSTCVGGNTGLQPCIQDCHGDWGGTAFLDSCSTCVGGNTGLQPCIQDCHGDWGGTAFIDSCSTCVGGNTGLQPCTQDCHGDWGGTAFIDSCNACVGGNTGLQPCTQDCHGDWGGTAYLDSCGICVGGYTGLWDCDTINAINIITWYNEINIYPNPLSGNDINIKAGNYPGNISISITDLTGKLIFTSDCYMEKGKCLVNINPMPVDGLYLFKIQFNGTMKVVKRLSIFGQ